MSLNIPKTNFILVSIEGGVATVELNRPKKRNALSQELIDELTGVLRQLDQDPEVRVVVLTSSGDAPFCGMLS
jgi:enoyl-CoA hydratase